MAVIVEKYVTEDLNIGHGAVTVTNPAGGTLSGTKINPGSLIGEVYAMTFAASLAIDIVNGSFQRVTLTADVTDSSITQSSGTLRGGTLIYLEIVQDATGGRLLNWPTNVLGASTYPISTTANDRTLVTLLYNGSNWVFQCAPTIYQ